MRVTTAPASTANEMPLTASILPYATRRSSTSKRAVIRAVPAGGRFLLRLRARVAGTTGGRHGVAPGGEGAPPGGTRAGQDPSGPSGTRSCPSAHSRVGGHGQAEIGLDHRRVLLDLAGRTLDQ